MTERLYRSLVVTMVEVNEVPNMNMETENGNLEKNENLEKDKGKKRAIGRKKERTERKKSFPINRNRKLFPNVLFRHLMKVMMTD